MGVECRQRPTWVSSTRSRVTALRLQLASLAEPSAVALHPNLPAVYRRKVEELERLLADPELAPEAMEAIRALIARIVLSPREGGPGLHADLHGDLARILLIVTIRGRPQEAYFTRGRERQMLGSG